MKININNKKAITFGEIKIGTVFQFIYPNLSNDCFFMKIIDLNDEECAVGLFDGYLYNVKNDWTIIPVKDCSLNVEV